MFEMLVMQDCDFLLVREYLVSLGVHSNSPQGYLQCNPTESSSSDCIRPEKFGVHFYMGM